MKRPSGQTFTSRLDLDRPECAALIGGIAMAWSYLEQVLALHFATVATGAKGGLDGYIYQIALESFDASKTMSNRKDLFLIAARRRFDESTVGQVDALLNTIGALAAKRNQVIHGRWRVAEEYPKALLYERRIGSSSTNPVVYDVARLNALLSAIVGVVDQLNLLFFNTLLPALGNSIPVNPIFNPPPKTAPS